MKIASIYNWYFDRDWQIGRVTKTTKTKEEIMASRQEHAKKFIQNWQMILRKKF